MIYPYILRFDDGSDLDLYDYLPDDVMPSGSALNPSSPSDEDIIANAVLLLVAPLPVLKPSAVNYYNIRRGDTLGDIARRYGMTVDDLVRLNGISNANRIKAGGRLRINDAVDDVYDDPYVSTYKRNRNRKLVAPSVRRRNPQVQLAPTQSGRTAQKTSVPPAVRHMITPQSQYEVDVQLPTTEVVGKRNAGTIPASVYGNAGYRTAYNSSDATKSLVALGTAMGMSTGVAAEVVSQLPSWAVDTYRTIRGIHGAEAARKWIAKRMIDASTRFGKPRVNSQRPAEPPRTEIMGSRNYGRDPEAYVWGLKRQPEFPIDRPYSGDQSTGMELAASRWDLFSYEHPASRGADINTPYSGDMNAGTWRAERPGSGWRSKNQTSAKPKGIKTQTRPSKAKPATLQRTTTPPYRAQQFNVTTPFWQWGRNAATSRPAGRINTRSAQSVRTTRNSVKRHWNNGKDLI